mgnify:CR=1 FL=1
MRVYIAFSRSDGGVKVAYACTAARWTHYYARRFDKSNSEADVLSYILSFINAAKTNERVFIITNNEAMLKIVRKMKNTDRVAFLGRFNSEEARDIFLKLQVVLIGGK